MELVFLVSCPSQRMTTFLEKCSRSHSVFRDRRYRRTPEEELRQPFSHVEPWRRRRKENKEEDREREAVDSRSLIEAVIDGGEKEAGDERKERVREMV